MYSFGTLSVAGGSLGVPHPALGVPAPPLVLVSLPVEVVPPAPAVVAVMLPLELTLVLALLLLTDETLLDDPVVALVADAVEVVLAVAVVTAAELLAAVVPDEVVSVVDACVLSVLLAGGAGSDSPHASKVTDAAPAASNTTAIFRVRVRRTVAGCMRGRCIG